jgi:hypothetical protein
MNRNEALAYLTRCADDNGIHWYQGRAWSDIESCPTCHGSNNAGHLQTPCSRYGRYSDEVALVVWRVAQLTGDTSANNLDYLMGLGVNDSPELENTLRDYAIAQSGADIDGMTRGYLECQLWLQTDYGRDNDSSGEPMLDANYSLDDIADETVESIRDMFASLVVEHPLAVRMFLKWRASRHVGRNGQLTLIRDTRPAYDSSQFGYDFYLTREGHGAGFWDRGLGELGDYLTQIAKSAGSADDLWDNGNGILA